MPSVLFLAYAFPPLAAPESWLAAKAARGLADLGVRVDVVRARPRWWHSYDDGLVSWSHEPLRSVHVVNTPWWLPIAQPMPWLRQFPDPMRLLQRRALRIVDNLDPDLHDALLTWSQWHSAHLVGLEVKRRHPSLRWVAHLSDPWVDNPLQPRRALAQRVSRRLERAVMTAADVVEFTSSVALEQAVVRHPCLAGKAVLTRHTFAPDLYTGAPPSGGPIVIRCVGSFYGARTPSPLIAGLAQSGITADRARVELVGDVEPGMVTGCGARALPDGLLVATGRVSYRDSLAAMRGADLLVMVDAPANHNVFVASKVVDYIGARRPIIALVPEGSSADIVRRLGGWVADPRDITAVAAALHAALTFAESSRGLDDWGDRDQAALFDATKVATQRARSLFGA